MFYLKLLICLLFYLKPLICISWFILILQIRYQLFFSKTCWFSQSVSFHIFFRCPPWWIAFDGLLRPLNIKTIDEEDSPKNICNNENISSQNFRKQSINIPSIISKFSYFNKRSIISDQLSWILAMHKHAAVWTPTFSPF